ncbi:MAG: MFS transporter [Caulobacter sp.]|nr:MFS transporter [Caulobacter sp.]
MSRTLRLGLFYCSIFIGTGASLPFMPVWFRAQGLSGLEIGIILSAPMLARIVITPLLAVWADGFALRRTPMILFGLAAAAAYGMIGLVSGFGAWLACWLAATTFLSTVVPLADVLTLRRSRAEGFNYGLPRGIGSIAFVVANITMGALLARAGLNLVLVWTTVAALSAGVGARLLLPADPVHEGGGKAGRRDRWRGITDLLRNRPFMLAVISTSLIQATHAYYYAFSALLWRADQNVPETTVGLLWATGVVVEIGFLWFMEPWRKRLGPERLVILGGIAAVARWTALAFTPPLWLLFPLQSLHALSFAAVMLGSLQLIERHAPARSASAAQTISSAFSGGLVIGLVTLASGPLFDAFRERGYLAMSVVALLGLIGAWRLAAASGVRALPSPASRP